MLDRSSRASRVSAVLRVLALLFIVLAPLRATAEPYVLRPGDEIRLSIVELPIAPMISQVEIDGQVNFPYVGSFKAGGLTRDELQRTISLAAAGKVVTTYSPAGERVEVALDGTGIVLDIAAYRPVYLTGDVARRGPITYLPGMSVRTALAAAGGPAQVPLLFEDALLRGPDLKSRYETATTEHARAVARLWGIDSLLDHNPDRPMPGPDEAFVASELFAGFLADERQNVSFSLTELERRKGYLTQQLGVLTKQIDLFSTQLHNHEEALALEQDQVKRVEQLVGRGVSSEARLAEARQGFLAVSSSALDAQSAMAALSLHREELQQQFDLLDVEFEKQVRAERSVLVPQIITLASQATAARQLLGMNGIIVTDAGAQRPSMTFEIARSVGDSSAVSLVATTQDTLLFPGDVVDVHLSYPVTRTLPRGTAAAPPPSTGGGT